MSNLIPCVGQRFKMRGVEFEVAHIAPEQLRYTGVAGGKQFMMAISKIKSLIKSEDLTLVGRVVTNEIQPDQLTKKEAKAMNYRAMYARHILHSTQYPGSKKWVDPLITEFAKEIEDNKPPSFSSCFRWVNTYRRSNQNPLSLVSKYANCGNRTFRFENVIDKLIQKHLSEEYLIGQRLPATAVHANIIGDIYARELDHLKIPSGRTINRRVREIDPYLRSKTRKGIYQANRKFKAAGQSYVATRILEAVEADGNHFDVLIVDPDTGEVMGRPYGTCIIDKYSRCILAFKITMIPFSAATLLDTLSTALSDENEKFSGCFENLIIDNGSDFTSHSLQNFCQNVGIRIEYGPPQDPDSKPHVERFFGTVNTQLTHLLPGTTFSNPAQKGEYKSEKHAVLTLEKFQEYVEKWLDIYHQGNHQGHGRCPEKLWEESLKDSPTITFPKDHLDTIARNIEYRYIVKGRVRVNGLKWKSHALATLEQDLKNNKQPTKVEVYIDSLDLSKVFVRDPRDQKVMIQCDSIQPEYTNGLSLYEHKIIERKLHEAGVKDLESYGEHNLEIKRWELWQEINEDAKQFTKRKIARLKETQKKQIENKKLVELEKEKRAKANMTAKSTVKPKKIDNKKSSTTKPIKQKNSADPSKGKAKKFKFRRLGNDK